MVHTSETGEGDMDGHATIGASVDGSGTACHALSRRPRRDATVGARRPRCRASRPKAVVRAAEPGTGMLLAGRYRLAELVGRGATAQVWRARDELLERDVAVKQALTGGCGHPTTNGTSVSSQRLPCDARIDHCGGATA
jgi:hypothetical protein